MPVSRDPSIADFFDLAKARYDIEGAGCAVQQVSDPGKPGHDAVDRARGPASADDAPVAGDFDQERRVPAVKFADAGAAAKIDRRLARFESNSRFRAATDRPLTPALTESAVGVVE